MSNEPMSIEDSTGLFIVILAICMLALGGVLGYAFEYHNDTTIAPEPLTLPEVPTMYSKDGCWVHSNNGDGSASWHPLRRCRSKIYPLQPERAIP